MSEKIYIETYGCQMNFADSEVVCAILEGAGYKLSPTIEEADFVLINTCAIRDNAEQRVRHRVRELRALQGRRHRLRIGILGCMAERLQSRLMAEEDNVSFVCGPDAYRRLPDLLRQVRDGQQAAEVELSTTETYADIEPVRLGATASRPISASCVGPRTTAPTVWCPTPAGVSARATHRPWSTRRVRSSSVATAR